jgi:hypothetical protein
MNRKEENRQRLENAKEGFKNLITEDDGLFRIVIQLTNQTPVEAKILVRKTTSKQTTIDDYCNIMHERHCMDLKGTMSIFDGAKPILSLPIHDIFGMDEYEDEELPGQQDSYGDQGFESKAAQDDFYGVDDDY